MYMHKAKRKKLGHGLINAQPNPYGGQLYHREVIGGMLFEARGDAPEVFDPVEEALDVVAFLVEGLGKTMAVLAVGFIGNSAPRPEPRSAP